MRTFDLLNSLIGDQDLTEAIVDELQSLGERTAIERKITPELKKWLNKYQLVLIPIGASTSGPAVMRSEDWDTSESEGEIDEAQQYMEVGARVRYVTPADARSHTQLGTGIFLGYEPDREQYPYRVEVNGEVCYLHRSSKMETLH